MVIIIKIGIWMVPKSVRFNQILPFHRLILLEGSIKILAAGFIDISFQGKKFIHYVMGFSVVEVVLILDYRLDSFKIGKDINSLQRSIY